MAPRKGPGENNRKGGYFQRVSAMFYKVVKTFFTKLLKKLNILLPTSYLRPIPYQQLPPFGQQYF